MARSASTSLLTSIVQLERSSAPRRSAAVVIFRIIYSFSATAFSASTASASALILLDSASTAATSAFSFRR